MLSLKVIERSLKLKELQVIKLIFLRSLTCLLYTSDAADERSSVDLGGSRIIKKKRKLELDGTSVNYKQKKHHDTISNKTRYT